MSRCKTQICASFATDTGIFCMCLDRPTLLPYKFLCQIYARNENQIKTVKNGNNE